MREPLPTRYFVDAAGRYLGGFAGVRLGDGREAVPDVPGGAVEVPEPPPSPDHEWNGAAWQLSQALVDARRGAAKAADLAEFDRPALRRLVKVLAARFGVTPAQLAQELRNAE